MISKCMGEKGGDDNFRSDTHRETQTCLLSIDSTSIFFISFMMLLNSLNVCVGMLGCVVLMLLWLIWLTPQTKQLTLQVTDMAHTAGHLYAPSD